MNSILIINDVHLGVERVAGTTPASQLALEAYLQNSMRDLIMQHTDCDLLIDGDLFDEFCVPFVSIVTCHATLSGWLAAGAGTLYLKAGNHDIGKRTDRPSAFSFLGRILQAQYPARVVVVDRHVHRVDAGVPLYLVPHCMNQPLFDEELGKVLQAPPGVVTLHANCMNHFAEHSDHSLNVSEAVLDKLSRRHLVLFSHEHPHRRVNLGGHDIIVMGNQWPSSISDCMGKAQGGVKYAHILCGDMIEPIETWNARESFCEVDWHELADAGGQFIRVTGRVQANEAATVIERIARYRRNSTAFVIANAVKVPTASGRDVAQESLAALKAFDVEAMLLSMLDEPQRQALLNLPEE